MVSLYGPLGGIRTPDLQNRNLLRYPAAPRADIYETAERNVVGSVFFLIKYRKKRLSHVKSEQDDIAVLHYIVLALAADKSLFLCRAH